MNGLEGGQTGSRKHQERAMLLEAVSSLSGRSCSGQARGGGGVSGQARVSSIRGSPGF